MFDRILAAVSIASLVAFMSVLVSYIAELDLTIITVVVLAMAVVDFYLLTKPASKSER